MHCRVNDASRNRALIKSAETVARVRSQVAQVAERHRGRYSTVGNTRRLWAGKSGCVYIGYSYNYGVVGGLEASPSAPAIEWRRQRGATVSHEDPQDELERLRKEDEALKKGMPPAIRMKVSGRGAVSVYGMGRFPVTLYIG